MTTTEYGIKYGGDTHITWYANTPREKVEKIVSDLPKHRILYSREVTEPELVQPEPPTTPGSVIRADTKYYGSDALFLRLDTDSAYPWVGAPGSHGASRFNDNAWTKFEVVFDAGA